MIISKERIEALVNTAYDRLSAGEKLLKLPKGTLQDLKDEQDYVMIIKIIATVEPVINELIELGMSQPHGGLGGKKTKDMFAGLSALLTDHRINLNGRPSKIDIAQSLNVISSEDRNFIEALSKIRNRYAHNIRNVTRDVKDMCADFCRTDAKFYEKLLRVDTTSLDIPNDALKFFIMISFSVFLQNLNQAHTSLMSEVGGLLGFMEKREQKQ
jgi:hypothetical protein